MLIHQRVCDFTENDLLGWEIALRKGPLPVETQRLLLAVARKCGLNKAERDLHVKALEEEIDELWTRVIELESEIADLEAV